MREVCLVTGANGFVGAALLAGIAAFRRSGGQLIARGAVRASHGDAKNCSDFPIVGDINANTDWQPALADVSVVVHAAARAHIINDGASDPLSAFRTVNVQGTLNLAEQALQAGIRRFIFISSIGVNGNQTFRHAFISEDIPNPQEPYAVSKFEAEVGLRRLFANGKAQLVIVRPPLIYGPNAPGNFGRLMEISTRGWPLPLGAIHNQRSFVALDNLIDLLITCIDHPGAGNQTFLVSDGQDMSTTELVRALARAAGAATYLLPVPVWALRFMSALVGKRAAVERFCSNLQVDASKTRLLLGWTPPVSVQEGLRRAVIPLPKR